MASFQLRLSTMAAHSLRRTCPRATRISSVRRSQFHRSSALGYAYKDDQSKDSLKPQSTEYSKSGSDSEAAETDEAFDPSKTSPESQQKSQESKKGGNNPLEVSPGNKETSKSRDPEEGGPTNAPEKDRARTSKTGSPNKAGGSKSG